MNDSHENNAQPLRELEWLSHYFKQHAREDLAQEIFEQVKKLRHRAQESLSEDAADIIDFNSKQRKASGSQ